MGFDHQWIDMEKKTWKRGVRVPNNSNHGNYYNAHVLQTWLACKSGVFFFSEMPMLGSEVLLCSGVSKQWQWQETHEIVTQKKNCIIPQIGLNYEWLLNYGSTGIWKTGEVRFPKRVHIFSWCFGPRNVLCEAFVRCSPDPAKIEELQTHPFPVIPNPSKHLLETVVSVGDINWWMGFWTTSCTRFASFHAASSSKRCRTNLWWTCHLGWWFPCWNQWKNWNHQAVKSLFQKV